MMNYPFWTKCGKFQKCDHLMIQHFNCFYDIRSFRCSRGKMCIRCLRNANDDDMDNKLADDNFSITGTEDGDNQSLISNEMGPKTYHTALSFPVSLLRIFSYLKNLLCPGFRICLRSFYFLLNTWCRWYLSSF